MASLRSQLVALAVLLVQAANAKNCADTNQYLKYVSSSSPLCRWFPTPSPYAGC
jgi:hypothetical protein